MGTRPTPHRIKFLPAIILLSSTLGLALSGCASQISALAPVGGDVLVSVRYAATEVMLEEGYDFLEAPVCQQTDTDITCQGKLMSGENVEVLAPLEDAPTMTITIDGNVFFEGNYQDVLNKQAGIQ